MGIFLYILLIPFAIFPLSNLTIVNSPHSPVSSPDWDTLLSIPIDEEVLKPLSQQELHRSRSITGLDVLPLNTQTTLKNDQNSKSKQKKSRSTNVTEEKRRIQNANYNRKRREILKRPENAEKLKMYKQKRSKANAAYRKRLVSEGNSGLASEQRMQTYLKHLERDRIRQKKKFDFDKQSNSKQS